MNKNEVLDMVKASIAENVISKEELAHIVGIELKNSAQDLQNLQNAHTNANAQNMYGGASVQNTVSAEKESLVPKVLYTIGGVVAVTGILVLLGNNWDAIGFIGRWLVTVGLGLVTFISAFLVYKKKEYSVLSQVLFTISSIASFIGGFVWINESRLAYALWDGADISFLISSILFVIFAIALYASKKAILHIISTTFFTIAYYSLVFKLLKGSGFELDALRDVVVYASMILAIGYFMYGSWLSQGVSGASTRQTLSLSVQRILSSIFTFASFGLFLISALFLTGIWNLLYAFIAIGAVVLSVKLKSKIGLIVTSIAIGIYCIKISVEYFADSISFSLALLISGLLIIALGYLTYYLNKKYIKGQSN